jgi:hypothetical protein
VWARIGASERVPLPHGIRNTAAPRQGAGLDNCRLAPVPPPAQAEIVTNCAEPRVHFGQQRILTPLRWAKRHTGACPTERSRQGFGSVPQWLTS